MSDSDDEDYSLPAGMRPVSPPKPTLVSERGARAPDPPKSESSPADRLKDAETCELRELVTKVITVRGGRKENLVPHWIAGEVLKIIDPHRQSPPFVRTAALVLLRDLAMEEMRAYRPPPNALKWIAEAEEAEAVDIRRRAAEEAEAHRLRSVPLDCGLCGKSCADERHSLILGDAPKTRVCETCIVKLAVGELQRHWAAAAAARAAKALEAACLRDSRRPKRKLVQLYHPPGLKSD